FQGEAEILQSAYNAALWAMEHRLRETNEAVSLQVRALRQEIEREFGAAARLWARLAGPVLYLASKREDKRLAAGRTYEPPTIVERRNWAGA
ncbi:MAG: B12-binding domain-containing radical SAM protein, partial [Acidobacteria bacterium]|nr:B12-binding domain-containing radical SAM protein [Acidobacteriota bacterium]